MKVLRAGDISLSEAIEFLASHGDTGNAIDGGAGSGSTAQQILAHLTPGRKVIAYEPFPGNHRFWGEHDQRVELRTAAIGSSAGVMTLAVSAVVPGDSEWGRRGLEGYSSAGRLVTRPPSGPHDTIVEVVVADNDVADQHPIGVVKLDLQGGRPRQSKEWLVSFRKVSN